MLNRRDFTTGSAAAMAAVPAWASPETDLAGILQRRVDVEKRSWGWRPLLYPSTVTVLRAMPTAVFDPRARVGVVVLSHTAPQFDARYTSPSGGGVGAADIAQHVLPPS